MSRQPYGHQDDFQDFNNQHFQSMVPDQDYFYDGQWAAGQSPAVNPVSPGPSGYQGPSVVPTHQPTPHGFPYASPSEVPMHYQPSGVGHAQPGMPMCTPQPMVPTQTMRLQATAADVVNIYVFS